MVMVLGDFKEIRDVIEHGNPSTAATPISRFLNPRARALLAKAARKRA